MNHIALVLLLVILMVPFADARARRSSSSHRATTSHSVRVPKIKVPSTRHRAARCTTCTRDSKGRIARSRTATRDFQKSHPCPSTGRTTGACSGYVIDHVVPLKRGGADSPGNMQWQTKTAAKAKDRVE
jgi:5-methylcytosine-specific restriction endonuclease McrA